MKKLIKEIAKREGKKSEVSVGNIREVLKHFAEIMAEHEYNLCSVYADEVMEFENYVDSKIEKNFAASRKKAKKKK